MLKLLPILFIISACGFKTVDTGRRGIKTKFGQVVSNSLPEGLYFYNPFTSTIIEMDVREQKWQNEASCYSKDFQTVVVLFSLNYAPNPDKMHVFYKNVGLNWAEKLLSQLVLGTLKNTIGKHDAVDLITNREKIKAEIVERLKIALDEKDISLKNFEFVNMDFNDAFEHAVEAKVVAIQEAEAAKNKTVQIQEEANQKVISAKAEAEAIKIKSDALAKNPRLIEYNAVEKWSGQLPTYLGSGVIPFLNLKN